MTRSVDRATASRSKKVQPFIPARTDDKILRALATFHYLTAEQLTRLLYAKGSLTYAREQLKPLFDNGYLLRQSLGTPNTVGRTAWVYSLGRKGLNYCEAAGLHVPPRFRRIEHTAHSYLHLSHALAVTDILIAAALLPKAVPGIAIEDLRHDLTLKENPVKVEMDKPEPKTGRKTRRVVPDGWINVAYADGTHQPIVVELDQGTEVKPAEFRWRIRSLVLYATKGYYEAAFATPYITIAYVVTSGEKRMRCIKRWTEEELSDMGKASLTTLFFFTTVPASEIEPTSLFLKKRFLPVFSDTLVALIADIPPAASSAGKETTRLSSPPTKIPSAPPEMV